MTNFVNFIRWIKREYKDTEVIITENGWSDDGRLNDEGRIEYLKDHLSELLKIIHNKECNLKAYTGKSTNSKAIINLILLLSSYLIYCIFRCIHSLVNY